MKSLLACCLALTLLPASQLRAGEPVTIFRTGEELIVKIDRLDLLRQQHAELKAVLQLKRKGQDKELVIDLSDPAVQAALVVDLSQFGECDGAALTVSENGRTLVNRTVSPIPEIAVQRMKSAGTPAYIEPGAGMGGAPRIELPDPRQLRVTKLPAPARQLTRNEITFPVVAEVDYPVMGGAIVGRSTIAPQDPEKASLYFTAKKAIYNGGRVARWQKFLVEVPIQDRWGKGEGNEKIALSPEEFSVHITNELSPSGKNILNDKEGDLGQLGEMDTDDQGRIYWRIDGGGGAYVVRFDPRTRKFEQPPARVDFSKLVPAGAGVLNDGLCKISCTRGRVYFTMCSDTLSSGPPGNPLNRRIGGVFSISQDWSTAAAFDSDIRLHVGSWEAARPAFYETPPKADAVVRKLGACSVTATGLFITTAEPKYEGGPWRLDLDDEGRTKFFGVVKNLEETVAADGTKLPPTRLIMVKGMQKGRELNVGPGGGRGLVEYKSGEITLPRASVRLLMQGAEGVTLVKVSKHVTTYEGAPKGTVSLSYDLIAKLKAHPDAKGALAESLDGGSSMGPAFLISPIPGETNKLAAVCEYAGYPLSVLDLSQLEEKKTVRKSSLPPGLPAAAGLGPYNSIWHRQGDEQWLYFSGYTGMSRLLYSKGGKALSNPAVDLFNSRLAQTSVDGHGRTSMKKIDGLLPVFGGRLLDSGYGLDGRGGDAFSTGVELFDPRQLSNDPAGHTPSQTSAGMSRCFALKTLQSRMVWRAHDGSRHQEIFAASGSVRKQIINELNDPSVGPANLDAKIFLYDVSEQDGLRALYGFSLPRGEGDQAVEGHIALSSCGRFLIIMTQAGELYSYHLARREFVDGVDLRTTAGGKIRLLEFKRPSQVIFTSPDGRIFFHHERLDDNSNTIDFDRVEVGEDGRLKVEPHLGIVCDPGAGTQEFRNIVRCFLPDTVNHDGSFDLILGYGQQNVQPFIRVIRDFIPVSATAVPR
ncbi:MAG TPA: hypothetical protein VGO11_14625 [Chthoniobacteraceae bacterium]|jgi:hypothetical protein|nr:hypothetical protein [Chthoniobacteraceae bacterium]